MRRQIKHLVGVSCTIILLLFILFVINQTAQVYQLASAFHPIFGQAVVYTLSILFICLISIPVWQFIKMPRKLVKPDTNNIKAMEVYQRMLVERLRKNPER